MKMDLDEIRVLDENQKLCTKNLYSCILNFLFLFLLLTKSLFSYHTLISDRYLKDINLGDH